MKISFVFLLCFCSVSYSQKLQQSDTAIVFSITVFNREDKNQTKFPDVFPNISNINLITKQDTVSCVYDFPFLKLNTKQFLSLKDKQDVSISFDFYRITANTNSRFKLFIPLKFPLTYEGAKFVLVEQDKQNKFYQMQKWGTTIYNGAQVNTVQSY